MAQPRRRSSARVANRRGQGFLEYLIILGVVIAAIIAFANGIFRTSVNNTLGSGGATIDKASAELNGVDLTAAKNW